MSESQPIQVGDRVRWIGHGLEGQIDGTICSVGPRYQGLNDLPFRIDWDQGYGISEWNDNPDLWHWGIFGLPEKRFEILNADEWADELELL